MTNQYLFSKILINFAIILLLLTPVINIPAPLFVKSLDVYGAVLFILIFCFFTIYRMNSPLVLVLVVTVFLVLLSQMFLLEIIYGYGDYTGISFTARSIITVIVAFGSARALIELYGSTGLSVFIKLIVLCALLQGAVLWLSFIFPTIRELMSVLFYRDFGRDADHLILLRVPGFVSTGGDGLSMNHALLCVVGLVGTYIISPPGRLRQSIIAMLFISMLGTAFTGRSGLYLGFVFMVTIILIQKNRSIDVWKFYRVFIFFLLLLLVLVSLGGALGSFGKDILDDHGYEHPIVRLLRGFIEMRDSGSYTDNTINTLLTDMVVLPTGSLQLLFGNNYFGTLPGSDIRTDVGYFRMLHGIGFFGLVIFLVGIFTIPLLHVRVTMKNLLAKTQNWHERRALRGLSQLLLVILLFGLVGHYKIFYLSTRIFLFVFFVFLFLVIHRYKTMEATIYKKNSYAIKHYN